VIGNPGVEGESWTDDSPRSWRVGEVVVDVTVLDILVGLIQYMDGETESRWAR